MGACDDRRRSGWSVSQDESRRSWPFELMEDVLHVDGGQREHWSAGDGALDCLGWEGWRGICSTHVEVGPGPLRVGVTVRPSGKGRSMNTNVNEDLRLLRDGIMRYSKLVTALSFVGVLATCKSRTEKEAAGPKPGESAALELAKAKGETRKMAAAMESYAYKRKAEFVAEMTKELASTRSDLDGLAAKVESSGGTARAEARAALATARERMAQTTKQLDLAERATESTWDAVKSGFSESYAGLKDSVVATRQWLSEKVAP